MNQELISVIIPTYKRTPSMIENSIDSVLKQTYRQIEIIIVDDSPDDFLERKSVKLYIESINDRRIQYIQHDKNRGANSARNTGITIAKGMYCAFLDDDDEWYSNKLEMQIKRLNEGDFGLVYCKAIIENKVNSTFLPAKNRLEEGFLFSKLMLGNFIGSTSFVLVKKECFDKVGKFEVGLPSNQDWELYLRISQYYKISYVNEILVKYIIHNGERISTNPQKKLKGWEFLYKKNELFLNEHPDIKNWWDIKMIPLYLKTNKLRQFSLNLIKVLKYSPLKFFGFSIGTVRYVMRKKIG